MIQSRGTFIWGLTCWELWSENSESLSFPWSNCSGPVRSLCIPSDTATLHSTNSLPSEPGICGNVHCIAWHGSMLCQAHMCAQNQSCNAGAWYNTGSEILQTCSMFALSSSLVTVFSVSYGCQASPTTPTICYTTSYEVTTHHGRSCIIEKLSDL